MDKMVICGEQKLSGQVAVSGCKNAILPILFSTLLAEGRHCFRMCPTLEI